MLFMVHAINDSTMFHVVSNGFVLHCVEHLRCIYCVLLLVGFMSHRTSIISSGIWHHIIDHPTMIFVNDVYDHGFEW